MLRVERSGATAIWTLNRPETKNALGQEMLDGLTLALDVAERDASLRAVILMGAGDVFCSGADLREARTMTTPEDVARFSDIGEEICRRIEELPVPVIACISGVAFGGGAELALACDMRVADANARISFKQVRMGVTTAWGTLARLVSVVGHGTASRLLTTAHEIGAMEARVLRLVDHVTERNGECLALALAWASDVEQGSPTAVTAMKSLVRASRSASYERLRPVEREAFVETWTGPDHEEAVAAFFERRAPRFGSRR